MEGSLDRMQELWDNGIEQAVKNYNAEQVTGEKVTWAAVAESATTENAAPKGDAKNQTFMGYDPETGRGIFEGNFVYTYHAEEGINNGQTTPQINWTAVNSSDNRAADGLPDNIVADTEQESKAKNQRWDNTGDDTAAERNGREIACSQIEAENAVLKDTVAALQKLTGKQGSTIAKHTMNPSGFPEGLRIFMELCENYILMQTSQARQMTVRRLPMATQSPTLWTCGAFGPTGAGTKPMPLMTASHSQRKVSVGVLMTQ